MRIYTPTRSFFKKYQHFRLIPKRLTLHHNPPVYHWLWWVWGK